MFFFTSDVVDPPAFLYMGKDKYENEELIKYGHSNDVWFHVDKLSSAHVYVRLREGETWDNMAEDLLNDCCHLVKANSIEGCKKTNVGIVYTPWSNLKKTAGMADGQVSFHDQKLVKRRKVEKRINEIVNRLNKTKTEAFPDLPAEQAESQARDAAKKKAYDAKKRVEEAALKVEREAMAFERSYDRIMDPGKMETNQYGEDVDFREVEDDFM